MAIFKSDWEPELKQIEESVHRIVQNDLNPMLSNSLDKASKEIREVVDHASKSIEKNIRSISEELHDQRKLTGDDIRSLIDYAAERFGETLDQRIVTAKQETAALITEKISQFQVELENTSRNSRKVLYTNLGVSLTSAVLIAAVGLFYKKISLGELDLFDVFRVALAASATGTFAYGALRAIARWRDASRTKRNILLVAVSHVGFLRPNGAWVPFFLVIIVAAAFFYVNGLS